MAKILIVDDDSDITEGMKAVLESRGHQVIHAPDGRRGLEAVKRERPHLIILDVMMETSDAGFSVARTLKKDPGFRGIPILMLTALKEKSGFDFKENTGDPDWLPVDDFADKPLKPDQLIAQVDRLLAGG